jgi:hypothetical protein
MKVFNKSFLFGTYNVTEQIDGFFTKNNII